MFTSRELGDQKVLAVLVTRSGLVRDRVLRLDLAQSDLDFAARYINENFRGWTMESMRSELSRRIEQERSEYDRLMNSIEQLINRVRCGRAGSQVVFVEGAANLGRVTGPPAPAGDAEDPGGKRKSCRTPRRIS